VLGIPVAKHRHQLFHFFLVADEVVVHQEDGATPFAIVEQFELGDDLRG
jgi:hypothetical protein